METADSCVSEKKMGEVERRVCRQREICGKHNKVGERDEMEKLRKSVEHLYICGKRGRRGDGKTRSFPDRVLTWAFEFFGNRCP